MFLLFNDEHMSQVLNNVLQVKQRGATAIVLTDLPDLSAYIDASQIDHVIYLNGSREEPHCLLAPLLAVLPLQLVCL